MRGFFVACFPRGGRERRFSPDLMKSEVRYMAKNYDVIIIGAGPAGIFTALEIADTGLSVLILEKGLDIRDRIALNKNRTAPASDRRANIVSGWGGAGAFSDGKLTLTTDYGGNLDDYMNKGELSRLISYVDSIYCQFGGADRKVYGDEHLEELHALKRKAAAAGLAEKRTTASTSFPLRAVTVLNGLPARQSVWASRRSRMLSTSVSAWNLRPRFMNRSLISAMSPSSFISLKTSTTASAPSA